MQHTWRERDNPISSMESELSDPKILSFTLNRERGKNCKCVDPSCYRYFRLRFINFN